MNSAGAVRVAVVGAGIAGLSLGIELLRCGVEVTLLERDRVPAGASRAANGAITPYSDTTLKPAVKSLAEETLAEYPKFIEWLTSVSRVAVNYDEGGVLRPFLPGDEAELEGCSEILKSEPRVRWLSSHEAHQLSGKVLPETIGALHYVNESRVDVLQLLDAMATAFRQLGGTTSLPTVVTRVSSLPSGGVQLETPWGRSNFDFVVLAVAGAKVSVDGMPFYHMSRVRGEIVELRTPPGLLRQCLYRGDAFLTPRRDGRLLAGTTYNPYVEGTDELADTAEVDSVLAVLSGMRRILPSSVKFQVVRCWKGWRPTSSDGNPIVGELGESGIWIMDGLGGLGYTLAPTFARRIAHAISTGVTPRDLDPFSVHRFQQTSD